MRTPKQLPAALNALLMTVKICTGAALLFVLAGCASPEEIAKYNKSHPTAHQITGPDPLEKVKIAENIDDYLANDGRVLMWSVSCKTNIGGVSSARQYVNSKLQTIDYIRFYDANGNLLYGATATHSHEGALITSKPLTSSPKSEEFRQFVKSGMKRP